MVFEKSSTYICPLVQRKRTDNNFRTFHAITRQKTNMKKGIEKSAKINFVTCHFYVKKISLYE